MLINTSKPGRKAAATRNPQRTRERLLHAAFSEIYQSGFRGTDLETILHKAKVTKGALYHHFESKETLGYALVDEVLVEITLEKWVRPLSDSNDPIGVLSSIIESRVCESDELYRGCPLNNLAQEMSPLDEGFRLRMAKVFQLWHDAIASALRRGQKGGMVKGDVDANEAASFLIAAYEGCLSLAKNSQDVRMLRSVKRSVIGYLESLREPGARMREAGHRAK